MKNKNGITLVSLVITIVVMIILASTGIAVGMETHKTAQRQAFVQEMQLIQSKADEVITEDGGSQIPIAKQELTEDQVSVLQQAYENKEIANDYDSSNYRYFSKSDLKNYFDLENIENDVIINFNTREVVSTTGIEYSGKVYYTQYQLPGGQVLKNQIQTPEREIKELILENKMDGLNANIKISGISITNGILTYKEENDTNWITITNYTSANKDESVIISKSGEYEFQLKDNTKAENVTLGTITIVTTNAPKENENLFLNTLDNNYDYSLGNWAKGTNNLSNTYIWIPRFAYKLNEDNTTYTIKYLKGTTNIATDNTYVSLTEYTLPKKFTDNDGNKLTGVWVKYEGSIPPTDLITSIEDENAEIITIK